MIWVWIFLAIVAAVITYFGFREWTDGNDDDWAGYA